MGEALVSGLIVQQQAAPQIQPLDKALALAVILILLEAAVILPIMREVALAVFLAQVVMRHIPDNTWALMEMQEVALALPTAQVPISPVVMVFLELAVKQTLMLDTCLPLVLIQVMVLTLLVAEEAVQPIKVVAMVAVEAIMVLAVGLEAVEAEVPTLGAATA